MPTRSKAWATRLSTPQWPLVRLHIDKIAAAVNAAMPGSYVEVQIPYKS